MYVPGIYIAWTRSKQVCTRKCMEKQYVSVYTWYTPRSMTFILYILVCTWSVHGIHLSVYSSSLFILFHILNMQNHSLKVQNLSLASTHAVRTRLNHVHTMLVYRNQLFCTYPVHTGIYTLRMALAGGQLSCGISAKSCLAASGSVCHCLNHADPSPETDYLFYWWFFNKLAWWWTMLSDVLTRKRQNATGKLTTCQSHS